jgi:plasmid rolling circle replication initiator protein Rep
MSFKSNNPYKREKSLDVHARPQLHTPHLQNQNALNINTLNSVCVNNNFLINEDEDQSLCTRSVTLEVTSSSKQNEGGEDFSLGSKDECIDTQLLIDTHDLEVHPSSKEQGTKSIETCIEIPFTTCELLPPKTIKALDVNLQQLKALNIERARLLSNSYDKKQRQLSQKLFQCARNVRISESGKPIFWQCKSRHCHLCHHFKQQKLLQTFKRNLMKNRYAPYGWKLITLTYPRTCNASEIRSVIKKLNANFAKLMRRKAWKDSVEGGVKAIEIARAENPKKYRPHLHILCAVNDSFPANPLFQLTRSTLDQLQLGTTLDDQDLRYNLSFVWGKYFKRPFTIAHIKSIKKNQSTPQDLPWLPCNKIDPHELTYTALEYITKGQEKDCTRLETSTPSLTTSTLIDQIKGIRMFSTFGTLQGYLTPPKRPKLTPEQRQALIDQSKIQNIQANYQYNALTKTYEKVERFTSHFESWSIFKHKANQIFDPCISDQYSPPHLSYQDQENPLRCKYLASPLDEE